MKDSLFKIESNKELTSGIYEMILAGDTSSISNPGQFVNIALDGLYLRRPISISDYDSKNLTLLYKVVGKGTAQMAQCQPGKSLQLLCPLGNGFDTTVPAKSTVLFGGGIGAAPLFRLAKDLLEQGKEVAVVLGFNSTADSYYIEEFKNLGAKVLVATMDGSIGTKGFVTDAIRESGILFDYFYACGPMPMLKAVCTGISQAGEVSLEARMGCGFGICMGCSTQTKQGTKRICKEGPVFRKEDVIW